MKTYYCPEHKYNPPRGPVCVCPFCEEPAIWNQCLARLAHLFEQCPLQSMDDLYAAGFTDLAACVERGWLIKTPGRWSSTYMAGLAVKKWCADGAARLLANYREANKS